MSVTHQPPLPASPQAAPETAAAPTVGLTLQVETTFSASSQVQEAWDDAVERLQGPVYMTYDWLRTWWRHYGRGKELRLVRVTQGDRVVALLPIYLEVFGVPPFRVRVARLVGANLPPKSFNPPVEAETAEPAFALLFERLFSTDRCHLLSLGPVTDAWHGHAGFRAAAARAPHLVRPPRAQPRDSQTLFHLPETFDEYLEALSPTERKNRMKRVRKLEREHVITTEVVSEQAAVTSEFEQFALQHAKQWGTIGKGGHFAAWPGAEAYNRELVQTQSARGRVRFFRLLAGDQVIANRYTFLFNGTVYSELPSRAVGEPWDGLGVGAISLLKFTEQVIGQGIRTVDSGIGAYDHKSSLGGTAVPSAVLRCAGATTYAGLASSIFLIFSSLFHAIFHKVWYRRLLPKLPASLGRTQSMLWLRFDA